MGKVIKKILIVCIWLLLWQLVAIVIHNKILLAGPVETLGSLQRMAGEAEFWNSLKSSYLHIMLGALIGIVLATAFSALGFKYEIVKDILSPVVTAIKAVPVASFIILVLIWIGSENVSTVVVALVVFPVMYIGINNAFASADKKLLEMAYVYRMPGFNTFRYIYLPVLIPGIKSALSVAIPMGFKSGVAAEVIGQPLLSMGNGLYKAKIYLDTGDVFAWTIVIVLVSFVTEKLFLFLVSLADKGGKVK